MTFVTFGSICFIAMPKSLYLMLFARAMIGFAHGYTYLTVLVHASEIVTQKMRGIIVASLNFCVISSVLVCGSLTMGFDKYQSFGSMQWIGILGIIYAVMGFIFIPILTRESPVQLIRQKKFDQAVALMVRLRNESSETWSIKNEYNELKAMVEEDEASASNIFEERNFRPLLLILLLKVASVLCFNWGVYKIRLNNTTMFIAEDGTDLTVMALMSVRLVAAMGTLFLVDSKGRKFHFLLSFGGSSVILILMGIMIAITSSATSLIFQALQIPFEIFGGFGIGAIPDIYASEAFNTINKPMSIMFTTAIEFLLQAAIIAITYNMSQTTASWIFLVGSGLLSSMITFFLHKKLPETAKMSIRQTRNEFLKTGEVVFSGSKMPAQNITFS